MNIDEKIASIKAELERVEVYEVDLWNQLEKYYNSIKPLRNQWSEHYNLSEKLKKMLAVYESIKAKHNEL